MTGKSGTSRTTNFISDSVAFGCKRAQNLYITYIKIIIQHKGFDNFNRYLTLVNEKYTANSLLAFKDFKLQ